MIIDPENKFIFIKTKKTASTSLEIALSSIASPAATVTAIKREDEEKRLKLGIKGARNYKPGDNVFINSRAGLPSYAKRGFYNHMTAWDVRRILGVEYNDYFAISIVRNPWDRCISHYRWSIRGKAQKPSFKDFLRRNPESINSSEKILFHPVKGELMVDFVVRLEHLQDDLLELERRLDLAGQDLFKLMEDASSKRKAPSNSMDYYAMYCEYTSGLVEMLCEKELECFGYSRPF